MFARLTLLVSASFVCGVLTLGCTPSNEYQPPPPPSVTVAKPIQQTVTNFLEESGTTEAVELVQIRARVRGFLEKINFGAGAEVEANEKLYLIQPREFEANVATAKAEVDSMKVALNLAEIELKRQENLIKDNATAQSTVDQARASRDGAKAALDAANAALNRAELDLEYTTVTTPIAGRVGKTLVKRGNLVGEGEATHLTTVVAYDPIYVNFSISERALLTAQKTAGTDSRARPDITRIPAFMGRATDQGFPFRGRLEYADLGVDQSTGTFFIRAIFPNEDKIIFPGLFVRIRVPTGTIENANLIPEQAIGSDQAGRFVFIVGKDDQIERRNVETGARYGSMIVVTTGLSGDEMVVLQGLQRIRPGIKVTYTAETLEPLEGDLVNVDFSKTPPAGSEDSELAQPEAPDDPALEGVFDNKPADGEEANAPESEESEAESSSGEDAATENKTTSESSPADNQ